MGFNLIQMFLIDISSQPGNYTKAILRFESILDLSLLRSELNGS